MLLSLVLIAFAHGWQLQWHYGSVNLNVLSVTSETTLKQTTARATRVLPANKPEKHINTKTVG